MESSSSPSTTDANSDQEGKFTDVFKVSGVSLKILKSCYKTYDLYSTYQFILVNDNPSTSKIVYDYGSSQHHSMAIPSTSAIVDDIESSNHHSTSKIVTGNSDTSFFLQTFIVLKQFLNPRQSN